MVVWWRCAECASARLPFPKRRTERRTLAGAQPVAGGARREGGGAHRHRERPGVPESGGRRVSFYFFSFFYAGKM